MKFLLSAIDSQNKEHVLSVDIIGPATSVSIDSEHFEHIETKTFADALSQYNKNFANGLPYKQRDYYKLTAPLSTTSVIDSLIRAFAVSSIYFDFDISLESKGSHLSSMFKTLETYFFDCSLIDWTGDMGTQPVMYFLKKETQELNSEGIVSLYSIGLLHKYEAYSDNSTKLLSFYVPFDLPDIRNIRITANYLLWKRITSEMNAELSKLNKQGLHP